MRAARAIDDRHTCTGYDPVIMQDMAATIDAETGVPELLAALRHAEALIFTARQYFPKSVRHSDRFELELANAAISKAIAKADKPS